jgi:hypothetical protein
MTSYVEINQYFICRLTICALPMQGIYLHAMGVLLHSDFV